MLIRSSLTNILLELQKGFGREAQKMLEIMDKLTLVVITALTNNFKPVDFVCGDCYLFNESNCFYET